MRKWVDWKEKTELPVRLKIYEYSNGFELQILDPRGESRVLLYMDNNEVVLSRNTMENLNLVKGKGSA